MEVVILDISYLLALRREKHFGKPFLGSYYTCTKIITSTIFFSDMMFGVCMLGVFCCVLFSICVICTYQVSALTNMAKLTCLAL